MIRVTGADGRRLPVDCVVEHVETEDSGTGQGKHIVHIAGDVGIKDDAGRFGREGGDEQVEALLAGLPGGVTTAMVVVMLALFLLGFVLDFIEITFVVVPIVAPVLLMMGFDPVWLGILITILLETALITPPVGVNLYIVHGVRDGGTMNDVIVGASPFVITMFVMIVLLVLFPQIALFLPQMFY